LDESEHLLEAGVAIVPASAFGGRGGFRISFATGEDTLREAIRRIALKFAWFTLFSSIQSRANRPLWISARTRRISARVSSVMIRGPVTYSPYSAVFEIE
jgi:hypothetical protein